jgi:hypothetical protein
MSSHGEKSKKAKTRKPNQPKEQKMKIKTKIVVIALALTATTSPVWSQDRQPLPSPTAHNLQGTWRVTRTGVDCITGEEFPSFPAITTYNQGGTSTGYEVPPGGDPGQGTEYGVWQREAGRHNYSVRAVSYGYTAEGDFEGRAEATEAIQLTTADSFTSTGTVQIFDADGNLIATICVRSTATRFE